MSEQMRVIQPVIQGEVRDTRYHKQAKQLEHLLCFTDATGQVTERWFLASQLEVVQPTGVEGESLPEGDGAGV